MNNYTAISFDLDGTLTKSRQKITKTMLERFIELSEKYHILVTGGGSLDHFKEQFLDKLLKKLEVDKRVDLNRKIFVAPTNSATMYSINVHNTDGKVNAFLFTEYTQLLASKPIRIKIIEDVKTLLAPSKANDIIDDRKYQITLSMLGKNADYAKKVAYDPDGKKRKRIASRINKLHFNRNGTFKAVVAGTTSIDIIKHGYDKSLGVDFIRNYTSCDGNVLFLGDCLFPGGNDWSVTNTKIPDRLFLIPVKSPTDTLKVINSLLKGESVTATNSTDYCNNYYKPY